MAKQERYTIVGLGEVLWDMLPEGRTLGGAPANFAYHAQSLGADSFIVSSIGDDDLGHQIIAKLNNENLATNYITQIDTHPTGTVTVELDKYGKPDYIIHENVAWDFIAYSPELSKLAKKTDAVCFGSLSQRSEISRQTVSKFLADTKDNCLCIFDINLRQSFYTEEIIKSMLKISTVFKLNDEELSVVAQIHNMEGTETCILKQLMELYNLKLITLTKGSRGSRLFSRDTDSHHPGITVEIADTVGAGDSFTAVIALGMLKMYNLDRINEHANRVAAFVCSQKGAMPILPTNLTQF